MIDIEDLIQYMSDEGKIDKYRWAGNEDIMITCPRPHFKKDRNGETVVRTEKRPSLGISTNEPYVFNCFGCGFRGTVASLVSEWLDIDLLEAYKWLSQRYEFDEEHFRKINEKELRKLKDYEDLFKGEPPLREYPESYFKPFRFLHQYSLDRGFTKEIAIKYELGYDKVQRRVVMPLRNQRDKIVGLYGRTIDYDNEVKYLLYNYTEDYEIEGFDRGKIVLFNKTEERKDTILVVESGLDVLKADQLGITDIVDVGSILSSTITSYQVEQLAKYKEIILALDNDYPGIKGTEKAIGHLGNRTKVTIAEYPNGTKDLGDCNKEQILEMIENRKSNLQSKVSKLKIRVE